MIYSAHYVATERRLLVAMYRDPLGIVRWKRTDFPVIGQALSLYNRLAQA